MSSEDRTVGDRVARERRYRRVLWISFVLSLLFHLFIVWGTSDLRFRASPDLISPIETVPAPEGLVVVDVAPTDLVAETVEDPRPEPAQPRAKDAESRAPDVVEREEPEPTVTPGAPGDVVVDALTGRPVPAESGSRSNAERLIPRFIDGRIWFDPRDPLLFGDRLARFARADSAVRAILRGWLDSLRLSDDQRRRAVDWTFEKDGKRWGISPEGLHLGDITIPIPFRLTPSGPKRREFEQALRDLQEIQLQDLKADLKEVADERREEMRKRSEEEAKKRSGDTTRVRRPPPRGPPD